MKTIDLSGSWRYKTAETESYGDKLFTLPGSTCDNQVGLKQEYYPEMTKEAVRAPRERYEYIAPLWLEREVDIPTEFEGKRIRLFLERVNIASELWIDDVQVGRQIIGLSTPHIYDLPKGLRAGKHIFKIKVDNRDLLNLDKMASGYSIDTQGYWNGIIGRIELQCEEVFHIHDIQVYPDHLGIDAKVIVTSDVHSPFATKTAEIELLVSDPHGKNLEVKRFEIKLYNSKQVEYFRYEIADPMFWDEFNPDLYTLQVKYICGEATDEKGTSFGMRTLATKNKEILLNKKPIALRGTTDCAIYPLTGYPPMDIETWRKNFLILKSYGLNHVRFHAWCPPESAFIAADQLGMYLGVEMPLWLNHDVCALEVGEDPIHRQYFMAEALRISKTYGNHPSFMFFASGNENMGDFELLEDIIIQTKAVDPRRLYTLTSNFDHPVLPCEDYLCAYEAGGHKVRIQDLHDQVGTGTGLDYEAAVKDVPLPIISFEIGQYCVYPNVDSISQFTGNMLPVNFDVIKKDMIKKGVYHRLDEYIKASGDLAVKLYKEDIEAALRTEKFGGFQLLSLCDYTGQSTATVGILDVFYQSKGLITPAKFRQFCSEVVPLFKAGRIFTNDQVLEAELALYDYGEHKIDDPWYELTIFNGDLQFYHCVTQSKKLNIPLNEITKSCMLTVTLKVEDYQNSWQIFVFAEQDSKTHKNTKVKFVDNQQELEEIIAAGGRAVVTTACFDEPIQGSFIPVFWSPVHFPSQKPCGAIIDDSHPIFSDFPTGKYPDYQWKRLLDNSYGMEIAKFGSSCTPIIETVPNFFDNRPSSPLFEVKINDAHLLFCGFDLEADYPEARHLKNSILEYMQAD